MRTLARRDFLYLAGSGLLALRAAADDCNATSRATQGPYWRRDAPFTNDLRRAGGETVTVRGVVRSAKTCKPLPNALLDVWQADHLGKYDLDYGRGETFGRARIRTNANGEYQFLTTRPAPYGMRPAHIHFIVAADGHRPLVTQLYFADDPHLESDPLRDVHADLVKPIRGGAMAFDIWV